MSSYFASLYSFFFYLNREEMCKYWQYDQGHSKDFRDIFLDMRAAKFLEAMPTIMKNVSSSDALDDCGRTLGERGSAIGANFFRRTSGAHWPRPKHTNSTHTLIDSSTTKISHLTMYYAHEYTVEVSRVHICMTLAYWQLTPPTGQQCVCNGNSRQLSIFVANKGLTIYKQSYFWK